MPSTPAGGPAFDSRATWTRRPLDAEWDGQALTWRCHPITDFWRGTAASSRSHNGSAYLRPVEGDFELEADLDGDLSRPLDQVGLFVERSATSWLKAGLELDDGRLWLSAVHTQDLSDQSRERWAGGPALRLRLRRKAGELVVACAAPDGWHAFRAAHCAGPLGVGVYSCAPYGDAFRASASRISFR